MTTKVLFGFGWTVLALMSCIYVAYGEEPILGLAGSNMLLFIAVPPRVSRDRSRGLAPPVVLFGGLLLMSVIVTLNLWGAANGENARHNAWFAAWSYRPLVGLTMSVVGMLVAYKVFFKKDM